MVQRFCIPACEQNVAIPFPWVLPPSPIKPTPAAIYLGSETSGLAIDFAQNSALVRDPAKILSFSGAPVDLLTYTSPSPKMTYGSDGVLRFGRHNLLVYSQEFDNVAGWSPISGAAVAQSGEISPDGSSFMYTLTGGTVGASRMQSGSIPVASSAPYTLSTVLKKGSSSNVRLAVFSGGLGAVYGAIDLDWTGSVPVSSVYGGVVSNVIIQAIGDGRFRISFTTTLPSDAVAVRVLLYPDTIDVQNKTVYAWGAQLSRGPVHDDTYLPTTTVARYDLPYDYDPVTLEAKGILIEEQRTNLWTNSQTLTGMASVNITQSGSGVLSVIGGVNYQRIEATAGAVTTFGKQFSGFAGTAIAVSFFAKKGSGPTDGNKLVLRNSTTGVNLITADFDYDTGVFSGSSPAGCSAVRQADGGWRITMVATAGITSGDNIVAYTGFIGSSEAAGEYFLMTGAQCEIGAFPTSYIPTTSAQVTRAADDITLATSKFPYNAAEGTLVGELLVPLAVIQDFIMIEDGIPESLGLYTNQNNQVLQWARDGGVNQVANQIGVSASADRKFAVAFKANDFAGSLDGGAVVTDNAGTMPTPTKLNLTPALIAGPVKNRHLVRLKYLPRRADNTELQELSA